MRLLLLCLLVSALCASISPIAFAQVDPVCREVAADADGDGFGWQDNGSCIVTMGSEPAPVIFNRETNEYVNLTRAYWNPPVDLYNKTIFCFNNIFNIGSRVFVPDNDPSRETHYTFHYTHFPLTATAPFTGTVRSEHFVTAGPNNNLYYNESFTSWSMDNGIYTGGAPFTESPYVEIVTVPSTNEKAIRTWRGESSFVQCSAVPTGVPPVFGSDSTPEAETTLATSDESVQDQMGPEQIPVELVEDVFVESSDGLSTVIASDPYNTEIESNVASISAVDNATQSGNPASVDAVLSNDATATVEFSNPFATTSGGGGSIGIWYLLLLAGYNLIAKFAFVRDEPSPELRL